MNTPILFLLGAVALSALGGLVVWIASRPRPEKFGSAMDTFNRDLNALAPPRSKQSRRSHQTRPARVQSPHTPASKPARPQDASTSGARPKPGPRPRS